MTSMDQFYLGFGLQWKKFSFYITPHFSFGYFSRSERLYLLFCHRRNFLSVGLPQSAAGRH
jgi:hypothetical protein